jgi:beta-1,4-N-acetylglucosaminyltransferase
MKILVTVGTTRFDSLIQYLDEAFVGLDHEFTFQIADGKYQPTNFPFFRFSPEINRYYEASDLVICHAGAGTIYKLLDIKKKIIIVPNTERVDNHQLDIAGYMASNGYAISIQDFSKLAVAIKNSSVSKMKVFNKHEFDRTEEIMSFCLEGLKDGYKKG